MGNLVQAFILPQAHNAPNKGKSIAFKRVGLYIFEANPVYFMHPIKKILKQASFFLPVCDYICKRLKKRDRWSSQIQKGSTRMQCSMVHIWESFGQ